MSESTGGLDLKVPLSIIVVSLLCVASAGVILNMGQTVDSSSESIESVYSEEVNAIFIPSKSFDVIILGEGTSSSGIQSEILGMQDAVLMDPGASVKQKLVVITDDWVLKEGVQAESTINRLIDTGSVVSLINTNIDWSKLTFPISYPDQATAYAMKKTPTGIACYSVICDSDSDATARLMNWSESSDSVQESYAAASNYELPEGELLFSEHEYQSSGYGWTSVRTIYCKLSENDSEYDYYSAHYHATMEPDSGSFNSGLDFKSVMNGGMMLKHGPGTSQGVTTVGTDISYSVGTDGISFTRGMSWEYSIPDVVVMNYTSVVNNILDIRHDVNEEKLVGSTSFFAEPGKLVKIPSSQSYSGTDTYKSQFCHKTLGVFCAYNDVSKDYNVQF